MRWTTEQEAYRKAAILEARYNASFNKLFNEQVRSLISRKFDIKFIDQFIKDTEKRHFRSLIMDEETKKMYTALKDQEKPKDIGERDQENLNVSSAVVHETQYDRRNEETTNERSNIAEYNTTQQNQRDIPLNKAVEIGKFRQGGNFRMKPIYAKIAVAVSIVLFLLFIGEVTAERCPGCGKKWSGSVSEYCFGCRAKQAQAKSYAQNQSGNSYSYTNTTCRYSNCGYTCVDGGHYCSRHTCTVDGCLDVATGNTLFKYCSSHEKSLTCAEDGCCRNRQKDSIYCNIHTAHRQ